MYAVDVRHTFDLIPTLLAMFPTAQAGGLLRFSHAVMVPLAMRGHDRPHPADLRIAT